MGIAGRTGCGKSTLALALFRIVESQRGSIHIDGVDVGSIGTFDLRSRIALVPQVRLVPVPPARVQRGHAGHLAFSRTERCAPSQSCRLMWSLVPAPGPSTGVWLLACHALRCSRLQVSRVMPEPCLGLEQHHDSGVPEQDPLLVTALTRRRQRQPLTVRRWQTCHAGPLTRPDCMQDPVLFSGSIRQNIDPFGAAQGDAQIWEALHRVGIKSAVAAMQVGSRRIIVSSMLALRTDKGRSALARHHSRGAGPGAGEQQQHHCAEPAAVAAAACHSCWEIPLPAACAAQCGRQG